MLREPFDVNPFSLPSHRIHIHPENERVQTLASDPTVEAISDQVLEVSELAFPTVDPLKFFIYPWYLLLSYLDPLYLWVGKQYDSVAMEFELTLASTFASAEGDLFLLTVSLTFAFQLDFCDAGLFPFLPNPSYRWRRLMPGS